MPEIDINNRTLSSGANNSLESAPLVSVILPIYNVSLYLTKCIDSVIDQTYGNIEIILIDDGSTDSSGAICDSYLDKDNRILVFHTENRGLSAARNTGFSKASGEYILFIDSDDWIEPDTVEKLIHTAAEFDAHLVDAGRCFEYIGKSIHSPVTDYSSQSFNADEILPAYASGVFRENAWNKLYRADLLSDDYFPESKTYEDVATTYKLMIHLAESGKTAAVLHEDLFHFRMRKSSISHSKSYDVIADCWTAYKNRLNALPEYSSIFISGCFAAIGYMWVYYYGFSDEEKAKAKPMLKEMNSFSKANFKQIINGNYRKDIKLSCLISQSDSELVLYSIFKIQKIRSRLKKSVKTMYD